MIHDESGRRGATPLHRAPVWSASDGPSDSGRSEVSVETVTGPSIRTRATPSHCPPEYSGRAPSNQTDTDSLERTAEFPGMVLPVMMTPAVDFPAMQVLLPAMVLTTIVLPPMMVIIHGDIMWGMRMVDSLRPTSACPSPLPSAPGPSLSLGMIPTSMPTGLGSITAGGCERSESSRIQPGRHNARKL